MKKNSPRLRMFAGPNGSGKTTVKSLINPELLGTYINPDEIELQTRKLGFLDFNAFGITTTLQEISDFFTNSSLLNGFPSNFKNLYLDEGKLVFPEIEANPYFASAAADFIRNKLVNARKSFTFETVMSHPDKIELLRKAQNMGYRIYLYFVATEDPSINISRVQNRVKGGGHSVPEDKIISRYNNSLNLLSDAIQTTHRAYIFDNSKSEILWVAEITNGTDLEIKTDNTPIWFKKVVLDKLVST